VACPEPGGGGNVRAVLTMEAARAECGPDVHIVGVIGSPVAHSLSPLLHNSAFGALGLAESWRSFAFEIPPGQAPVALAAMRSADITGLSVTMPHKEDVAGLVDECSDIARRLTAVNCVHQQQGHLYGTNTDGEGFLASLARGAAFEPMGKRCVVIGAGGAARAVVLALARAGASDVAVVNRTPQRAFDAAALAGREGTVVPLTEGAIADAVVVADLVVNATPVGMDGAGAPASAGPAEWLVAPGLLTASQVAADLVYAPRPTSWLAEASAAGATTLDGLGMLVHQAAAQLALWTGATPPVEAMWQAAEAASPSRP
jgi:shikimate dehydrogenase